MCLTHGLKSSQHQRLDTARRAAKPTFTKIAELSNVPMYLTLDKLAAYRDEKRLLLVFAPSAEDEKYMEQKRGLEAHQAELQDRDISVFYLLPSDAALLHKRFSVSERSFTVVLIGKDGTEKKRYDRPVQPDDLFSTIDQMPMRRREMLGK